MSLPKSSKSSTGSVKSAELVVEEMKKQNGAAVIRVKRGDKFLLDVFRTKTGSVAFKTEKSLQIVYLEEIEAIAKICNDALTSLPTVQTAAANGNSNTRLASCGHTVNFEAKFCPECGASCGLKVCCGNTLTGKFCPSCGKPANAETAKA